MFMQFFSAPVTTYQTYADIFRVWNIVVQMPDCVSYFMAQAKVIKPGGFLWP